MALDPIRDALSLPWGGHRNLALRAALGLEEGEVGMVNQGDVVQVVVGSHSRASGLARRLKSSLTGWHVGMHAREDRQYVVTCYEDEADLAVSRESVASLRRMLG